MDMSAVLLELIPEYAESLSPANILTRRKRRQVSKRVVVVDGCNYGRAGLVAALHGEQQAGRLKVQPMGVGDLEALNMLRATAGMANEVFQLDCLVVRLPKDPRVALSTLLQLGAPGTPLALTERLVVLSALAPELVLRVLSGVGVRLWVRALNDRLPLSVLCRAICPSGELCVPGIMAWSGILLMETSSPQLSSKEREVLWQCLQMVSVHTLARRLEMSSKTLYTQRQGALNKLGAAHLKVLLCQFRVLPDDQKIKEQ